MLVKISTTFNTTPEVFWKEIQNPSSLQFISLPILYFIPKKGTSLDGNWETSKDYNLNLFLFKFIPLGFHQITLRKISKETNEISSSESGFLAKTWNHTIRFKPVNSYQISYTDIVEIKAGFLTIFIWLFAHFFYHHRQRKNFFLIVLIHTSNFTFFNFSNLGGFIIT